MASRTPAHPENRVCRRRPKVRRPAIAAWATGPRRSGPRGTVARDRAPRGSCRWLRTRHRTARQGATMIHPPSRSRRRRQPTDRAGRHAPSRPSLRCLPAAAAPARRPTPRPRPPRPAARSSAQSTPASAVDALRGQRRSRTGCQGLHHRFRSGRRLLPGEIPDRLRDELHPGIRQVLPGAHRGPTDPGWLAGVIRAGQVRCADPGTDRRPGRRHRGHHPGDVPLLRVDHPSAEPGRP